MMLHSLFCVDHRAARVLLCSERGSHPFAYEYDDDGKSQSGRGFFGFLSCLLLQFFREVFLSEERKKKAKKNRFWQKKDTLHTAAPDDEHPILLRMAPTTRASSREPASRVTALPEFWTLVAEHSGLVGAWRLTGVCRASRLGAKEWLRGLRRLVVCGGYVLTGRVGATREVWRLDLGEMRWERMGDLGCARLDYGCCTVRGNVVVLGGVGEGGFQQQQATVEVLRSDNNSEGFAVLPSMSCGPRSAFIALPVDESASAEGQVLLIGGDDEDDEPAGVVVMDLATGACTPQPPLLSHRWGFAAARLRDGRVVCAGGCENEYMESDVHEMYPASMTAEVLEPPPQGSPDDAWRWRQLPHMTARRFGSSGCVLSDGRFAVFGGSDDEDMPLASCEVLTLDGDDERWEPLPPMREPRIGCICAAVEGCVIVAGGWVR